MVFKEFYTDGKPTGKVEIIGIINNDNVGKKIAFTGGVD